MIIGTTALAGPHSDSFHSSLKRGHKSAQKFPATGQTTSTTVGDDGDIQAGAPLSYTVNRNGTITDNNTKLMWEKKAQLDGLENPLNPHDADNIYTWDEAFDFIDRLNSTPCFARYCDWRLPNIKEIQSIINYDKVAPAPAVSEAFNSNCTSPSTDPNGSCTATTGYWSSTTTANSPASAWYGYFVGSSFFRGNSTTTGMASKSGSLLPVRAVRGGLVSSKYKRETEMPLFPIRIMKARLSSTQKYPATGQTVSYRAGDDGDIQAGAALSYKDNGDGTITDNNTGFMWEKKILLNGRFGADPDNPHDADNQYTWRGAFGLIARLNSPPCFANYCDWRLPNIKELQSIVNYGNAGLAVSEVFNTPDCASNPNGSCTSDFWYWSSTTDANGAHMFNSWLITGDSGSIFSEFNKDDFKVRAVRGGSSFAARKEDE